MKDPAFLFYPGDWYSGTMLLTRHQKGCYIDLLIAQFNNGPLSLESIKTILGQDQAIWTVLSCKFKQNSAGNYFNERLATEVEKRKAYSESRRRNKEGTGKSTHDPTYVEHMTPHMENENAIRNTNEFKERGVGKGWNTKPGEAEIKLSLPPLKASAIIEQFKITKYTDVTPRQVQSLWAIFKAQHFTGTNSTGQKTRPLAISLIGQKHKT